MLVLILWPLLTPMSSTFREFVRKIGSGAHTSQHLTRSEAAEAARLMLQQEATPAQIGAFLIAHRIKRPTGEELAGMLDAYDELGPAIPPIDTFSNDRPVMVAGVPYDGRSRTAPLSVAIALLLAEFGQPVLMHGGDRMPTKYGLPLLALWQALGIDWSKRSIDAIRRDLQEEHLSFVYLPKHFPLAHQLVAYREDIGKRPPLATLELIWSPYRGQHHLVAGFVHPPTETMMREAFSLRGTRPFTLVKGLEGSCDLPSDRTSIIGLGNGDRFERLCLSPWERGWNGENVPLDPNAQELAKAITTTLQGQDTLLRRPLIWNGGFYLWRLGCCTTLEEGYNHAELILKKGILNERLKRLRVAVAS